MLELFNDWGGIVSDFASAGFASSIYDINLDADLQDLQSTPLASHSILRFCDRSESFQDCKLFWHLIS